MPLKPNNSMLHSRQLVLVCLLTSLFLATNTASWSAMFYATDVSRNRVLKADVIDLTNNSTFAMTGLNAPLGIAVDSIGNVYVANTLGNDIRKFSSSGDDLGVFASSGIAAPYQITFGPSGDLFVVNPGTPNAGNGSIRRISSTGIDLGNYINIQLELPRGLAFDASGNLYVSYRIDTQNNSLIRKFDQNGQDLGVFSPLVLDGTGSLTIGPQGDLFVGFQNGLRRFRTDGTDLGFFGDVGFSRFHTIFLPDGNSLASTGNIMRFNANGQAIGFGLNSGGLGFLALAPSAEVPEPSLAWPLAFGLLVFGLTRQRFA